MHNFEKLFVNIFFSPSSSDSSSYVTSLQEAASFYEHILFIFLDIEKCIDLVKAFKVEKTPIIILSDANKKPLKTLSEPNQLILELEDDYSSFQANFQLEKQRMFKQIEEILSVSPIMVFIKGTPQEPKCGFTASLLEILKNFALKFGYFNILESEDVRNWLRFYAKWNTYPQFYVEKKLIGGLDVIKDLISKGEFEKVLPKNCRNSQPEDKLARILDDCRGKVLVIYKGKLQNEENQQVLKQLSAIGVKFVINDAEKDEDFAEFLTKKFQQKLPICFFNGEFAGNAINVKESHPQLLAKVDQSEWSFSAKQKFEFLLENFATVCFIEGDLPENPEVVDIFQKNSIDFQFFNVHFDKEVKEIVEKAAKSEVFPLVFHKKQPVGGLEVMRNSTEVKKIFF